MEPQSKPAPDLQDLIDPAQKTATAITVAATAFGLLAVFLINLISGAMSRVKPLGRLASNKLAGEGN